jgi:hypothetical protein
MAATSKHPALLEQDFPGADNLFTRTIQWKLLHLSLPPLACWLLSQGAAVNATISNGRTPLDYILYPQSVHQAYIFGMDCLQEVACLLVRSGGRLNRCTLNALNMFLKKLTDASLDISPFAQLALAIPGALASPPQQLLDNHSSYGLVPTKRRNKLRRLFKLG